MWSRASSLVTILLSRLWVHPYETLSFHALRRRMKVAMAAQRTPNPPTSNERPIHHSPRKLETSSRQSGRDSHTAIRYPRILLFCLSQLLSHGSLVRNERSRAKLAEHFAILGV